MNIENQEQIEIQQQEKNPSKLAKNEKLIDDISAALSEEVENLPPPPPTTPPQRIENQGLKSTSAEKEEIIPQISKDSNEGQMKMQNLGLNEDPNENLFETVVLENSPLKPCEKDAQDVIRSQPSNEPPPAQPTENGSISPATAPGSQTLRLGVASSFEDSTTNQLKLRVLQDVHKFQPKTYKAPRFCDICGKVMLGLWMQGHRCSVCRMDVHAECRVALVTPDHRCRRPQHLIVHEEAQDAPQQNEEETNGTASPERSRSVASIPEEVVDPINSEWHQRLRSRNEQWVPDSVAPACMICGGVFGIVRRRHHCRRCGACVCAACSGSRVSDKILSMDAGTGAVQLVPASGEPVRTCTRCTEVIDCGLRRALKKQGWGQRKQSI